MDRQRFEKDIKQLLTGLLKMAEDQCYNEISCNLNFILSDTNEFDGDDFFQKRRSEIKINSRKIPQSLEAVINTLQGEYSDLYDINLYIFKASKKETTIEIQYFRKSNLDPEYLEKVKDNPAMLHSKISMPKYAKNNRKFDINWQFGGVRHQWENLIYNFEYRKMINNTKR